MHRTGGLADSVRHFDPASGEGTGCVFNDFDLGAVRWALATTLAWYEDRSAWTRLMQNAMAEDFSGGDRWCNTSAHFVTSARQLPRTPAREQGIAPPVRLCVQFDRQEAGIFEPWRIAEVGGVRRFPEASRQRLPLRRQRPAGQLHQHRDPACLTSRPRVLDPSQRHRSGLEWFTLDRVYISTQARVVSSGANNTSPRVPRSKRILRAKIGKVLPAIDQAVRL